MTPTHGSPKKIENEGLEYLRDSRIKTRPKYKKK